MVLFGWWAVLSLCQTYFVKSWPKSSIWFCWTIKYFASCQKKLGQMLYIWRIQNVVVTCNKWSVLARYSCSSFNATLGLLAASLLTFHLVFSSIFDRWPDFSVSLWRPIVSTCWCLPSRYSRAHLILGITFVPLFTKRSGTFFVSRQWFR